jgi:peroxiredoxin
MRRFVGLARNIIMRSCRLLIILSSALLLWLTTGHAADSLKLGGQAPNWSGLKGTDGKVYSSNDFQDKDVLVVVFTCNSCPYAQDYEDRIIALVKQHCGDDQKAALVAINANKVKEDLPEEMQKRAKAKGFNFPYVWDETQTTAKAYGAKWTPEFYVFDKERKLIYRGAMDDKTDPKQATINYVAEAIDAALAGKTPKVQETPAVGCAVRYERPKRTK